MAKKNSGSVIGAWTFVVGVVIAVLFAFLGDLTPTLAWILVVVGLVVGFLNIADDETQPFLMSGAVLIIAAYFGSGTVEIIPVFGGMLSNLLLIFVPATIIVALKNVFGMARM